MTAPAIVSLREMLLTYSRAFGMACADLEMVRGLLTGLIAGKAAPDLVDKDHSCGGRLLQGLNSLREICVGIPTLDRLLPPIDRLATDTEAGTLSPEIMSTRLHALQHALFDELSRHWYLHVVEGRIAYYTDALPFGEEVFQRFPSATDDILAAGRCIALGEGTAAVFHLMLVLELGLTALGRALKIPYAPSWESYLTQIQKKMSEKHPRKTAAWKREEAFYRDVAGDLQMIKLAWRNPTMHIVRGRTYSIDDAESIYKASKILMQRLASRLKEPSRAAKASAGMIAPSEDAP